MKILFITTVLPYRVSSGGEVASKNFIDAIRAAGHEVRVFGFQRPGDQPLPDDSYVSVGARHIETDSAGWRAYIWLLFSIFSGRPYIAQKFFSFRYRRKILSELSETSIDIVVVDHSQMGWALEILPPSVKKVFIAHNVESKLYSDQAENKTNGLLKRIILNRDSRLIDAIETRLVDLCEQTWTLVQSECRYFQEKNKGACDVSVMALPGVGGFAASTRSLKLYDVGLIGTWAWDVNRRGLHWFLKSVVPLLDKSISIAVAGKGADSIDVNVPSVTFLGYVKDASEFVQSCKLMVVPTVTGAGIQLKTIEALSLGAFVVSTTLGVRGIDDLPNSVLVADTPEAMAEAIQNGVHVRSISATDGAHGLAWFQNRQKSFSDSIQAALLRLSR